jgi:hypothetical protein
MCRVPLALVSLEDTPYQGRRGAACREPIFARMMHAQCFSWSRAEELHQNLEASKATVELHSGMVDVLDVLPPNTPFVTARATLRIGCRQHGIGQSLAAQAQAQAAQETRQWPRQADSRPLRRARPRAVLPPSLLSVACAEVLVAMGDPATGPHGRRPLSLGRWSLGLFR